MLDNQIQHQIWFEIHFDLLLLIALWVDFIWFAAFEIYIIYCSKDVQPIFSVLWAQMLQYVLFTHQVLFYAVVHVSLSVTLDLTLESFDIFGLQFEIASSRINWLTNVQISSFTLHSHIPAILKGFAFCYRLVAVLPLAEVRFT